MGGRIVSRSVSLKRTEESLERKRRRSPSPKTKISPKKKVSVLERRKAIESKYGIRRNEKGKNGKFTKETAKERKEKARREAKEKDDSSDEDEASIAKMLKNISKDIKEVKSEMKISNERVENMSKKINKLEVRTKTNEEKTEKKLVEIQESVRIQIRENNASLQDSISKTIIESLKPKISAMHSHIVKNDLKRIVEEQLQLRSLGEVPHVDAANRKSEGQTENEATEESNKESEGEETSKPEPERKNP